MIGAVCSLRIAALSVVATVESRQAYQRIVTGQTVIATDSQGPGTTHPAASLAQYDAYFTDAAAHRIGIAAMWLLPFWIGLFGINLVGILLLRRQLSNACITSMTQDHVP